MGTRRNIRSLINPRAKSFFTTAGDAQVTALLDVGVCYSCCCCFLCIFMTWLMLALSFWVLTLWVVRHKDDGKMDRRHMEQAKEKSPFSFSPHFEIQWKTISCLCCYTFVWNSAFVKAYVGRNRNVYCKTNRFREKNIHRRFRGKI